MSAKAPQRDPNGLFFSLARQSGARRWGCLFFLRILVVIFRLRFWPSSCTPLHPTSKKCFFIQECIIKPWYFRLPSIFNFLIGFDVSMDFLRNRAALLMCSKQDPPIVLPCSCAANTVSNSQPQDDVHWRRVPHRKLNMSQIGTMEFQDDKWVWKVRGRWEILANKLSLNPNVSTKPHTECGV